MNEIDPGAGAERSAAIERSSSLDSSLVAILCAAMALGTWARFAYLERCDLDAAEALSWFAATAPNLHDVIMFATWLNPGKVGVHDTILHFWIRVFGDSLFALRGLSATLGMISILLTFAVVRALLLGARSYGTAIEASRNWIAATTALLVATNLPMIVQSRSARMYMVLVPVILGQVWFFLRAERNGRWWDYLGLSACTLLAIATHFTAGAVVVAEVIWLTSTLRSEVKEFRYSPRLGRSLQIVGALAVTGLILLPIVRIPLSFARTFVKQNGYAWIRPPVLLAPIEFFVMGLGGAPAGVVSEYHAPGKAFILMTALAIWGAISGWRVAKEAATFALLWIFVPLLLLQIVSYLATPIFLVEYALSSFIPYLLLVALGLNELGSMRTFAALAIALVLVAGPIRRYVVDLPASQWKAATQSLAANLRPGERAVVVPSWAIGVVHYYLRTDAGAQVIAAPSEVSELRAHPPNLMLITDGSVDTDPVGSNLLASHPQLVQRFNGVSLYRFSPLN